jgi:hypothetical protein
MTAYMMPDDGLHILEQPSQTDTWERRRARINGANWGAGFFGWLVAVAVAVLLSAAFGAVLVAFGILGVVPTRPGPLVSVTAWTLGFGVLLVSYYAGGYVAGRMSRFDGGLQGLAVWIVGLLPTTAAAGLALALTPVRDLVGRLAGPTLQAGTEGILVRDLVVAVLFVVGPLLVAVMGGRIGCRYHHKVDEAIDLATRARG